MADRACIAGAVLLVASLHLGAPAAEVRIDDPLYGSRGSWGQDYGDQWALERVGFTPPGDGRSAWDVETGKGHAIVVAVVDTGIDFFHPDLEREAIWRNPGEERNGKDDDGNGYVDDLIGWNFVDGDNDPWDHAGHGTVVAGLIAASTGNAEGIAGINWGARIMPLKVLNFVGRGRSTRIAEAVYYAVDNGARVVNLSLGGRQLSRTEKLAIDYAESHGVLVVVAAGNEGIATTDFGPAGHDNVITVGATDPGDRRTDFSNWGKIDVVAPGVDVLSLRARRTDLNLVSRHRDYEPGGAFVGPQAKYYRVTGTSFAAPFVTGLASLILARDPELTVPDVRRMILHSARDVETPGVDQVTGYGLIDARAALTADPAFFVDAAIDGVQAIERGGRVVVQVQGTADADRFDTARIELGRGKEPAEWTVAVERIDGAVRDGFLGDVDAALLAGSREWMLRLVTVHANGRTREARFHLELN